MGKRYVIWLPRTDQYWGQRNFHGLNRATLYYHRYQAQRAIDRAGEGWDGLNAKIVEVELDLQRTTKTND